MRLTRGNHAIIGPLLLKHQPHGLDVFLGISPVTFGFEIGKVDFLFQAGFDPRRGSGDFTSDKGSPRRGDS